MNRYDNGPTILHGITLRAVRSTCFENLAQHPENNKVVRGPVPFVLLRRVNVTPTGTTRLVLHPRFMVDRHKVVAYHRIRYPRYA